jgi:DNA (cytosine-5)-methyltransferase 1
VSGTYVSLFSGLGGLDLAVEAVTGFRCVAQVERDPACLAVLERHWPGVPRWDDVRSFPATHPSLGLGQVDLVCGGFPCQPVSVAGKRRGTDDERWLWPEFARVLGALRPRYAFVENVPGLLTANGGRAFSEVLGDLAALGYDAIWGCLRASDVGAPHRRERLFILATDAEREPGELLRGSRELAEAGESPFRVGQRGWDPVRRGTSDAPDARIFDHYDGCAKRSGLVDVGFGPYTAAVRRWEAVMGPAPLPLDDCRRPSLLFVEWMMGFSPGWVDGLSWTQAMRALGNAVVPQQGAAALRVLAVAALGALRIEV